MKGHSGMRSGYDYHVPDSTNRNLCVRGTETVTVAPHLGSCNRCELDTGHYQNGLKDYG